MFGYCPAKNTLIQRSTSFACFIYMNIILLSGGSGKRLWPLSNRNHAKQFLPIFELPNGEYESMLQRMYRMISNLEIDVNIVVAAPKDQKEIIIAQLGKNVSISEEPCRRDTFPAIALASSYLHHKKEVQYDDVVIVCPIDSFVDQNFFKQLKHLHDIARNEKSHLSLMGIQPKSPSEKYGYIIPNNAETISIIKEFKEKPDIVSAQRYIEQGALWNCGVFAFKLQYIMDISLRLLRTFSFDEMLLQYSEFPSISFDYAVVEKEPSIQVLRFNGMWKDIGTWDSLTEVLAQNVIGKATAFHCENTHIINKLYTPIIALGVNDLVIVATCEGILVTSKQHSHYVKQCFQDQLDLLAKPIHISCDCSNQTHSDDESFYSTNRIVIHSNQEMTFKKTSCHRELWTVIRGSGLIQQQANNIRIQCGTSFFIEEGVLYNIHAISDLHIMVNYIHDIGDL